MSTRLPAVKLDDRDFQDLVNEARLRIAQSCPEWTEHNVSDPGVTLIELFAWMTEMVIYRLNRIPDKLHVALMELLGIALEPATAARADVRFRLSAPATAPVFIPAASTEVATPRTPGEDPVVFQTLEDVTVPSARPTAYQIERGRQVKDVGVANGTATPKGPDQLPFGMPPTVGDALYIGFDEDLSRMLLRVDVDCSQARGAGVDPEDPPLRWEMSSGEGPGGWAECEVLLDATGGFNYGSGVVELQLPSSHDPATVGGTRAHWVRCRLDDTTRRGAPGATFSHPPEIYSITAAPLGALVPAAHSVRVDEETIGESDGTPGQSFALRNAPVLTLDGTEGLEVMEPDSPAWRPWQLVESFAEADASARVFTLDPASGTVSFGPAIRTGQGSWDQYGAVPPKGSRLRMSYRHGGGRRGNVAAGALTVLKSAIPTVSTVVNPAPAAGGVDPETLEAARQRAAMEIRTRYRAVTGEDFEFLCGEASPRVARAICVEPPDTVGVARLHLVPRIEPADRLLTLLELTPDEELFASVAAYLDERRLIGTRVELVPARYRGVSIVVNLQANLRADPRRVEEDVAHALYTYLNPLVGGAMEGQGTGWAFGRALNQGELYGVIHQVEGVDFVKILRVYETDLQSGEQQPKQAGSHIPLDADELIASGKHLVRAEHPEL
ncbi:MAG: putative baseplate assembly protein [Thermoleophilia bacterium]